MLGKCGPNSELPDSKGKFCDPGCVNLGKSFAFSVPSYVNLQNGHHSTTRVSPRAGGED